MMDISDLQATLHEHADVLVDDRVAARAPAARRRAHTIRLRRVAAVAAAVVVVPIAGAAILGGNALHRSEPPVDAPDQDPAVAAGFAGRTLLDSEVVRDGSELTLTFDTGSPTQWTASCFGVDAAYTLHLTLDGASPGQAPCETEEPPEPLANYVLDRRYEPGMHTLRLWLTAADSSSVVAVPESVLAAGVYRLPEPVAVVAGVDVYEREYALAQEWRYVASDESDPGARSLVSTHEQPDNRALPRLVADGVPADHVVLLVDGVETPAEPVLDGSGYLEPLRGGISHTIELRLTGDVPEAVRLGVVWRSPAT
jgi:hypothetical protein